MDKVAAYLDNLYFLNELEFILPKSKIDSRDIMFFEKFFKVKLPNTFKNIILKVNGGIPKPDRVGRIEIDSFISFKKNEQYNVLDVYNNYKHRFKGKIIIPFAKDSGGNLLVFEYSDYRDFNPSVVFFDHSDWGNPFQKMSNSFEEFIKMFR